MQLKVSLHEKQKQAFNYLLDDTTEEVLFGGAARGGKAQPLYSKILTTSGWKTMGDMKIGDELVSPSGGTTKVIALHPQGPKDIYEIEMIDGGKTHATAEHLWYCGRSRARNSKKVRNTMEMKAIIDKGDRYHVLLPTNTNTDFGFKQNQWLHPYILGALLGDGGMTTGTTVFTSADEEVIQFIKDNLPDGLEMQYREMYAYAITGNYRDDKGFLHGTLKEYLLNIGIWGDRCENKKVPSFVFNSDKETRLEVLRGLMDTDGFVDTRGQCYFSSKSRDLADGVRQLVLSLGGKASVYETRKSCMYKGERKWGVYYDVYISINPDTEIFRLKRKKDRLKHKLNDTTRRIKSITFLEHYPAQCITVDKEDGLYITDDYIVTHNSFMGATWLLTQAFSKPGSSWLMGRTVLKELYNTTLRSFWSALKEMEKINGVSLRDIVVFNEKRGTLYFKENDVVIYLIDLAYQPSDPEYNRIGSLELTGAFIDEAQQVHPKAISVLAARFSLLSQSDKDGNVIWRTKKKCLYTCNPDKGWVYKQFYKPWKDGNLEENKKFIPSLVTDNSKIPEEDRENYVRSLKAQESSDPISVQRLLYGNFDYDETEGRLFDYDALNDLFTNPHFEWKKRYITCDVARGGKDTTVIYVWEGYNLIQCVTHGQKNDFTEQKIKELAQHYKIPMSQVLVDENGVGGGIVDNLKCRGFIGNRSPVSPLAKKYKVELNRNYQDLRCQCYMMLSRIINERKMAIHDQSIKQEVVEELDLMCQINMDKDGKIEITTKQTMKEKLGRSPDKTDGIMMRAWFDLYLNDNEVAENDRIFNPHIDEDIYGNKLMEKSIDDWLNTQRRLKNTYEAKLAEII